MDEALVEKVARAICRADYDYETTLLAEAIEADVNELWFNWRAHARAAIAAIQAHEPEQLEDLQSTIARIRAWCEAYPINMFPDQDLKKADEVLKAAGISMSAMHGQWARHIMQGVARIVGAAPEPERPADIPKQAD